MQADMHFYVTYVAAVAAGFSLAEAADIAHAAHYVDCSGDPGPLPSPFSDVQGPLESTIGPVRMLYEATRSLSDRKARDLWAAFHFLPANDDDPGVRYEHAWDDRHRGRTGSLQKCYETALDRFLVPSKAKADAEARRLLRWRCFPFSNVLKEMKKDTLTYLGDYRNDPQTRLALIGIRLHVLADTFSHAGCSAPLTPSNLFSSLAIQAPGGVAKPHARDGWLPLNFANFTRVPVEGGAIGHGRYGALPDFPGIIWRAEEAGFDRQTVYRNNPVVYEVATWALYHWLKEFREDLPRTYDEEDDPGLKRSAKRLLRELDFSSGPFEYPGRHLRLGPRNRDFLVPFSQRYHYFQGQLESDAYLEERCNSLYKSITGALDKQPVPLIHDPEDFLLKQLEQHHRLGQQLTTRIQLDVTKPSWDEVDKGTEYRIIRRVRVHYFENKEKLRAVNAMVHRHKDWFQQTVLKGLD